MGEGPAEALVVCAVGADDVVAIGDGVEQVFGVLARLAVAAHILHAVGVVDGYVGWADSDDRAVLLVELQDLSMAVAGDVEAYVRDVGDCP